MECLQVQSAGSTGFGLQNITFSLLACGKGLRGVEFPACDEERTVIKVEGKEVYKSNSSSVFNIVVLTLEGWVYRIESANDRLLKPGKPSLSVSHSNNRSDHDSLILKILNLRVIRRLENLKSVKSWVSGFWGDIY